MTLEPPITTTADYHVQNEFRDTWSVTNNATGEKFLVHAGLCGCKKFAGYCAHKIMAQVADAHPQAILPAGFYRLPPTEETAPPVAEPTRAESKNMNTKNHLDGVLAILKMSDRLEHWLAMNGAK